MSLKRKLTSSVQTFNDVPLSLVQMLLEKKFISIFERNHTKEFSLKRLYRDINNTNQYTNFLQKFINSLKMQKLATRKCLAFPLLN